MRDPLPVGVQSSVNRHLSDLQYAMGRAGRSAGPPLDVTCSAADSCDNADVCLQ